MSEQSGSPRRAGTIAPFVAAVAVLAVVVAAVLFWPRAAKHDPMACPKAYPLRTTTWVPAKPLTDEPAEALVPDGLPDRAVVCGYEHSGSVRATVTSNPLTGSKQLHGDPRAVVKALRATSTARSSCTLDIRPTDRDNYLLALSYDGKIVWVSMPGNHCAGASNGVFRSTTNLRADAAQAVRHGVWPTDPSLTGMCDDQPDPKGAAVLSNPVTSASVCLRREDGLEHVYRLDRVPASVATAYNAAAGRDGCTPGNAVEHPYVARLGQPGGAAVLVGSPTCAAGPGGRYVTGTAADSLDRALTGSFLGPVIRPS